MNTRALCVACFAKDHPARLKRSNVLTGQSLHDRTVSVSVIDKNLCGSILHTIDCKNQVSNPKLKHRVMLFPAPLIASRLDVLIIAKRSAGLSGADMLH